MRLILSSIFFFIFFIICVGVKSNEFEIRYNVKTSGVVIGKLKWNLKIKGDKYISEINLESSGIFSALYNFHGEYHANGILKDNIFETQEYKQKWKTKQKSRTIEISFDNYIKKLSQDPVEKERSRIDLYELFKYFDPTSSFLSILNGAKSVNTIDGRRIYTMKKSELDNFEKIVLEIENYKNIWADHKRNDLEKIEFEKQKNNFLPESIIIYFKKRVFKLKKI